MIFFVEFFLIQIYFISTNNNSAFKCTYPVFCTNCIMVPIFITSVYHTTWTKFNEVGIQFSGTGLLQCWNYLWQFINSQSHCCTITVSVLFGSNCVCALQNKSHQLPSCYFWKSLLQQFHIRPIFLCWSNVMLTFIFKNSNTIYNYLLMLFGKLCSIELHKWVLYVLERFEKHDKGSGQNCPDHDLNWILVHVVVHWLVIPKVRGVNYIEFVTIPTRILSAC